MKLPPPAVQPTELSWPLPSLSPRQASTLSAWGLLWLGRSLQVTRELRLGVCASCSWEAVSTLEQAPDRAAHSHRCGHCKKLAPEYEKAAKELSKSSPPIPLAKVDAIAETDLAKRFDVSSYPTLKIFRKGKALNYNGPREKYGRAAAASGPNEGSSQYLRAPRSPEPPAPLRRALCFQGSSTT